LLVGIGEEHYQGIHLYNCFSISCLFTPLVSRSFSSNHQCEELHRQKLYAGSDRISYREFIISLESKKRLRLGLEESVKAFILFSAVINLKIE
jgi:hypothetical protein